MERREIICNSRAGRFFLEERGGGQKGIRRWFSIVEEFAELCDCFVSLCLVKTHTKRSLMVLYVAYVRVALCLPYVVLLFVRRQMNLHRG